MRASGGIGWRYDRRPTAGGVTSNRWEAARWGAGLAIALLLVLAGSRPNATATGLGAGRAPSELLPLGLTSAWVTVLMWGAYVIGAAVVVVGLGARTRALPTWVPLLLGGLALVTVPIGSADHLHYAAYGRILIEGGDPWLVAPDQWRGGTDPVVARVEEPWRETPSVYGPLATLVHAGAALVGGDSVRDIVWAWQVVVVLAWLAVRWLLRSLTGDDMHGRVDLLWTLNPLVFSVGVLGAHVDMLAAALALAAVAAARVSPVLAGVATGLAASTKFTYGVVALALLGGWWLAGRAGFARRAGLLVLGVSAAVVPLHLWAGPHVFDQISTASDMISLVMPWRAIAAVGVPRALVRVLAAALAVALAVTIWRLTRARGEAPGAGAPTAYTLRLLLALGGAYAVAAPYSLPWYDLLAWVALPAVPTALAAGGRLVDGALLTRLAVAAAAYVPGRVLGMSETVETVTLAVRKGVGPVVHVVLWVLLLRALMSGARGGSAPPSDPPPQRSAG